MSTVAKMSGPNMEEISRRLYRQLDCTGYNLKMINARRKAYRSMSKYLSSESSIKGVLTGSRGTGIAKMHESDQDMLFISQISVSIENVETYPSISADKTIFTMLNSQPGHCILELRRKGDNAPNGLLAKSLVKYQGKILLSSKSLKTEMINNTPAGISKLTGPAQTSTSKEGTSFDVVYSIPCLCKTILDEWFNRPRTNDWPPLHVRQTVLQMTGNLVGTGIDGSETEYLEWRYCFNEIEMLIMESLNDTQLKLYKLLKIINTDIFKKQGHNISSFMLKNIILWLAETHPQSQFLPETLYHWVCEALVQFKQYIEANNVPYYMIPDRNLLKEKVKESDRPKLLQLITDVIESGPIMLYECETIKKYEDFAPQELDTLKQKLEDLELCELDIDVRKAELQCLKQDPFSDPRLRSLIYRSDQILSSGWPSQIQLQIIMMNMCFDDSTIRNLLS